MTRIAVIVGSTRPGRRGPVVADWVASVARSHYPAEVTVEVVDLADHALPLLDEPVPAVMGDYRNPHTTRWARTVESFDGFVFVVPEYNHSFPAALKNAVDYLFAEWNDKAAGFVGYGAQTAGARGVEHLRLTLAEVKVACVRAQVALSMYHDFVITDPREPGEFAPGAHHEQILCTLLDEVRSWSEALSGLRAAPLAG
ncbi:NADPH-dependent FMN reductase [Actinokineospora enzanensis]|uniref:NADPH-dependent FMN reductase n=1 Tax=Actinokineospora enzanensis TaxID=155975 RepID=UPI0003688373|nr:NAD(P)H-dependent oxidoreductase [Actinokineospora enzanensis]